MNSREDKWCDIISRCKSSGMSVRKWCAENNLSPSSYKYWNTRLNKPESNCTQWAEIAMPVTEEKSTSITPQKQTSFTICMMDISVKIEKGFDRDALAELLTVLCSVC